MTRGVAALERVAAFHPHAAVVFGSGLAALPHGAEVEADVDYAELGWPSTAVPGHANLLRLASVPVPGAAPAADGEDGDRRAAGRDARLRLALACGRPHGYEGWSRSDLERPVRDLVAADARRLVFTNSCGSLRPDVHPGDIVACSDVIDLQAPPKSAQPQRLDVCRVAEARAVAAAVRRAAAAAPIPATGAAAVATRTGTYVAVTGPQFETPAEVEWLAGHGDVVGMSGAPEVRAAHDAGASCCLLALVANRAAAVGSHEDVLAVGALLAGVLASALTAVVLARWAKTGGSPAEGASWIS